MNPIECSGKCLKYFLISLCLCSCAIHTANFQTAKSLDKGKGRVAIGLSTGLHLEEVSYSKISAENIQKGGEPDKNKAYQRPLVISEPSIVNVLDLSAISLHGGIGLGHDFELNSSLSAGLMAASGRIGLKYQLPIHASHFFVALNPMALYAISQGGSSPEDEVTDGQQIFAQYILNDKTVFGVELPMIMTWLTQRISYNISPMFAYYDINITKAFRSTQIGRYQTVAGGLAIGTYFRGGNAAIGPEVSLVVLKIPQSESVVNINYGFGLMSDF